MLGKNLIQAATGAGGAAGGALYIEDVMSTWLYTGNSSTQTITNGIDLAGEGGLVWTKSRTTAASHALYDTERGATKFVSSNAVTTEITSSVSLTSFNSDGFTLGPDGAYGYSNFAGYGDYASWTFRKAPKFFDVVTYTGTGANRTVAHNLGSVPGCIIVKRTDTTSDWQVYHRSLANTEYMVLNSTAAKATGTTRWNSTTPTDAVFSLGTDATVNASGGTYVAYLFAHDAGGFGDDGTESVIKCGSFTTDGSGNATVDLGWEPQWLLYRNPNAAANWDIEDTMRGAAVTDFGASKLLANSSSAEGSASRGMRPSPTGFNIVGGVGSANTTLVYIAIRRGPMKTPTSGAEVFGAQTANQAGTGLYVDIGAPLDALWLGLRGGSADNAIVRQRLTASNYLVTSSTAAEVANTAPMWQTMQGAGSGSIGTDTTTIGWGFRRAPGFFDVVAYTGTGVARTVPHNLGVAPELMIVKNRGSDPWVVYHAATGATKYMQLNSTAVATTDSSTWSNTAPTSSVFTVDTSGWVNGTGGQTYIAYLFATCPGVSKCFSFTGNGTSQTIDCGFAAGAKFVLLKRTDSTGNWLVADTARGIVSGNDPLLYLNSTAAEITTADWIDPASSGFTVVQEATANANVNGATYIGLAIS